MLKHLKPFAHWNLYAVCIVSYLGAMALDAAAQTPPRSRGPGTSPQATPAPAPTGAAVGAVPATTAAPVADAPATPGVLDPGIMRVAEGINGNAATAGQCRIITDGRGENFVAHDDPADRQNDLSCIENVARQVRATQTVRPEVAMAQLYAELPPSVFEYVRLRCGHDGGLRYGGVQPGERGVSATGCMRTAIQNAQYVQQQFERGGMVSVEACQSLRQAFNATSLPPVTVEGQLALSECFPGRPIFPPHWQARPALQALENLDKVVRSRAALHNTCFVAYVRQNETLRAQFAPQIRSCLTGRASRQEQEGNPEAVCLISLFGVRGNEGVFNSVRAAATRENRCRDLDAFRIPETPLDYACVAELLQMPAEARAGLAPNRRACSGRDGGLSESSGPLAGQRATNGFDYRDNVQPLSFGEARLDRNNPHHAALVVNPRALVAPVTAGRTDSTNSICGVGVTAQGTRPGCDPRTGRPLAALDAAGRNLAIARVVEGATQFYMNTIRSNIRQNICSGLVSNENMQLAEAALRRCGQGLFPQRGSSQRAFSTADIAQMCGLTGRAAQVGLRGARAREMARVAAVYNALERLQTQFQQSFDSVCRASGAPIPSTLPSPMQWSSHELNATERHIVVAGEQLQLFSQLLNGSDAFRDNQLQALVTGMSQRGVDLERLRTLFNLEANPYALASYSIPSGGNESGGLTERLQRERDIACATTESLITMARAAQQSVESQVDAWSFGRAREQTEATRATSRNMLREGLRLLGETTRGSTGFDRLQGEGRDWALVENLFNLSMGGSSGIEDREHAHALSLMAQINEFSGQCSAATCSTTHPTHQGILSAFTIARDSANARSRDYPGLLTCGNNSPHQRALTETLASRGAPAGPLQALRRLGPDLGRHLGLDPALTTVGPGTRIPSPSTARGGAAQDRAPVDDSNITQTFSVIPPHVFEQYLQTHPEARAAGCALNGALRRQEGVETFWNVVEMVGMGVVPGLLEAYAARAAILAEQAVGAMRATNSVRDALWAARWASVHEFLAPVARVGAMTVHGYFSTVLAADAARVAVDVATTMPGPGSRAVTGETAVAAATGTMSPQEAAQAAGDSVAALARGAETAAQLAIFHFANPAVNRLIGDALDTRLIGGGNRTFTRESAQIFVRGQLEGLQRTSPQHVDPFVRAMRQDAEVRLRNLQERLRLTPEQLAAERESLTGEPTNRLSAREVAAYRELLQRQIREQQALTNVIDRARSGTRPNEAPRYTDAQLRQIADARANAYNGERVGAQSNRINRALETLRDTAEGQVILTRATEAARSSSPNEPLEAGVQEALEVAVARRFNRELAGIRREHRRRRRTVDETAVRREALARARAEVERAERECAQ